MKKETETARPEAERAASREEENRDHRFYRKGFGDGQAKARAEVLAPIKVLVEKQASDEGLWFVAKTAPEGYLQQELRRLHTVIERELDLTKDLAPSSTKEGDSSAK